jgi:AcrR family transcriptional regulator
VTDTLGLRERKKDATRRALAERALSMARERGYHGFTITDLVEDVGVSRRTFSNYFSSKAECLAAVTEGWLDDLLAGLAVTGSPEKLPGVLRDGLVAVARDASERWGTLLPIAENEPELHAYLLAGDAAIVERVSVEIAERSGLSADDLRVCLLAAYAVTAGRECIGRWLHSFDPADAAGTDALADLLETAFSLIDLRALTPDPHTS